MKSNSKMQMTHLLTKQPSVRLFCCIIFLNLFITNFITRADGGDDEINSLKNELILAQNKITDAFASFRKSPESVLEKGAGMFATVPPHVQALKEKLANQRAIYIQRVEKRRSDQLISEDRRKKSLELYTSRLNAVARLDDNCKEIVDRIEKFLSKDIPRIKNDYAIDSEDFSKDEAKKNLSENLGKIETDFRKIFLPSPAVSGNEKKN
jgi:hypothetical protein